MSENKKDFIEKVLDKGYIEVVDALGDDLTPVNAARVSFGGRSKNFTDKDRRLSKFLIKHKHFSPFRHQHVMMIIKAPEFVMRQWYKHVVGIETTSDHPTKDHAWNEISGRYKPVNDFYMPKIWRKQSASSKQASDGTLDDEANKEINDLFMNYMRESMHVYEEMIKKGVAKEEARIVLPLNQYTEVIWTCSAQALLNFIELRDEPTAQVEIRDYAVKMREIVKERFPVLHDVWFEEK